MLAMCKRFVPVVGMLLLAFHPGYASTFTADPSVDGWSYLGNSLQAGLWANGSTSGTSFNAYSRTFTLGSTDNAIGGLTGNPTGLLANGSSWQVGDLILGLGVMSTGSAFTGGIYYKFDFNGSSPWQAASSVGAGDGVYSFGSNPPNGGVSGFQHPQSYLVGKGDKYSNGSGTVFTNGGSNLNLDSAMMAWSTLGSSGPYPNPLTSEFLLNYSQLMRLGVPVSGISNSKVVISAFGAGYGQDIVIGSGAGGGPLFAPVPEPGTIGLASLALFAGIRKRLKKQMRA